MQASCIIVLDNLVLTRSCRNDRGPDDAIIEETYYGSWDIRYYFSVVWVTGCRTTVDKQNQADDPLGDGSTDCGQIMKDAYSQCKF